MKRIATVSMCLLVFCSLLGYISKVSAQTGAQKLFPDISVIGAFAGGFFSTEPTGPFGHDPARSGLTLQEIEVAFQSTIDPYLRGDVFLAIHEAGIELEEGYATTLSLPKGLQMKAGRFLLPFGRQNQKHIETWDFVDNPLVTKYFFGSENLKELAVEASYLFPFPFFFQFQGTFSNGENTGSFGGTRRQDFLYQGRLTTSLDLSEKTTILTGSSIAVGPNSTSPGNQTYLVGGDLLLKWKPKTHRGLTWQMEYLHRWMEMVGTSPKDGGLYSYIDYQFLKRWHAGIRYDQMGLPQGLILKEWRLTPALTFNLTEFSRLRAQYEYGKISGANGVHAAFLQLEFSMGPHGAHAF